MNGIAASPAATTSAGASQAIRSKPDFGGGGEDLGAELATRPSMICCLVSPCWMWAAM